MNSAYQKSASKEHHDLVEYCSKFFNGEMVAIRGNNNIKGMYFPDVKTIDTDIEIEVMPKAYIQKKISKWDAKRKKILVIGFSKLSLTNFNEIYCLKKDGTIIKVF